MHSRTWAWAALGVGIAAALGGAGGNHLGTCTPAPPPQGSGAPTRPAAAPSGDRLFDGVAAPAITRLTVRLRGRPARTLVRRGAHLVLQGTAALPPRYRLDAAAAAGLAAALASARGEGVLPRDPGPAATGLGARADVFRFTAGGATRTLRLGAARSPSQTYARVDDRPEVHLVGAGLAQMLRARGSHLRDLRLVALDPAAVRRLELRQGRRRLVLVERGGHWKAVRGGHGRTPDDAAVRARLVALARVRAISVATGGGPTGLDRPTGEAVATLAGGRQVRLRFGADTLDPRGTEVVYARGSVDALVYWVIPWTRQHLLAGIDSLDHPPRDPLQGVRLDLRALTGRATDAGGGTRRGMRGIPPEGP